MRKQSPIRVGMITYDWYPFDPRVRRMAEAAVDGGFDVDVICLRQPEEPRYEDCRHVHVYRLPQNRAFGRSLPMTILGWWWFMLMATFVVTRLHLKHAYDVVHVHNMPDFLVFSALFVKLMGARVILDVQDVSPELMSAKARGGLLRKVVVRLAIWQERFSAAFADHVVTVGWPFEKALRERGLAPSKITNIINSSDPKMFPAAARYPAPYNRAKGSQPFIVMYHGTLAGRNGLDIAVRALALVHHEVSDVRLDIMGRGEEIARLKELAASLGVGDYLQFTGPCSSDKIVDFVLHGDVGIIPYKYDGFMELVLPTKAYEFAWMQRPIIASNTPAVRSMFRPESVALCDPAHPENFAEAILDLYHHPEKRARMVECATEDYQQFDWEAMAARYQQLLLSLSRRKALAPASSAISSP